MSFCKAYFGAMLTLLLILSPITADPLIVPITESIQVNTINIGVTRDPDITMLSQDYFLCTWSHIDSSSSGNYSNEIYAQLLSMKTGKAMLGTEFIVNTIQSYSQDTPSTTLLFNASNELTQQIALVWESQILHQSNTIIDAIYGRILKWSIVYNTQFRYVKMTSPTATEFQISPLNTDIFHHKNPQVVPIYDTDKFLVSWISTNRINKSILFIRIYYNNGNPYSFPVQIHDTDSFLKTNLRTIALSYGLSFIAWVSEAASSTNNVDVSIIYGIIVNQNGENKLINTDQGKTFVTVSEDIDDVIPVSAYLYTIPETHNHYFVLGWLLNNTVYAAIYMYNDELNNIEQISSVTSLFYELYDADSREIEYPQIETIGIQLYTLETNAYYLAVQIALCYDVDKSDIYCKILEAQIFDRDIIKAIINSITDTKMINTISSVHQRHEYPRIISSQAILRSHFTNDTRFVVAWSSVGDGKYDVHSRVLQVNGLATLTIIPTQSPQLQMKSTFENEENTSMYSSTMTVGIMLTSANKNKTIIIVVVCIIVGLIVIVAMIGIIIRYKKKSNKDIVKYEQVKQPVGADNVQKEVEPGAVLEKVISLDTAVLTQLFKEEENKLQEENEGNMEGVEEENLTKDVYQ